MKMKEFYILLEAFDTQLWVMTWKTRRSWFRPSQVPFPTLRAQHLIFLSCLDTPNLEPILEG